MRPPRPLEYLIKTYGLDVESPEWEEMRLAWIKAFRPKIYRVMSRNPRLRIRQVIPETVRVEVTRGFRDFISNMRALLGPPDPGCVRRSNIVAPRLAPYVAAVTAFARRPPMDSGSSGDEMTDGGTLETMSVETFSPNSSVSTQSNKPTKFSNVFPSSNKAQTQLPDFAPMNLKSGQLVISARDNALAFEFLDPGNRGKGHSG